MKVQLYCDETLLQTYQGTRDEIGAKMKDTTRNLALTIDDDFELQNRLTVLFNESSVHDLVYQSGRFRFRLHAPERAVSRVA